MPVEVSSMVENTTLLELTVFDLISAHFPISAQYDNV